MRFSIWYWSYIMYVYYLLAHNQRFINTNSLVSIHHFVVDYSLPVQALVRYVSGLLNSYSGHLLFYALIHIPRTTLHRLEKFQHKDRRELLPLLQ